MLDLLIQQLGEVKSLDSDQIELAVAALVDKTVSDESKAAFLAAFAKKGETAFEIAAFAKALRLHSIVPPLDPETRSREILDVCGTGGDRLNTFNISTTVAIVAAAAGVTVAKHGNRAITSQAGSADVLEALGIRINLAPEEAAVLLRDQQFAFLFARQYHPAFEFIAPARKLCADRGQRTIFNILGPLLNPARPSAQLVGVPRPELCEPMGLVLQSVGARRGLVVSGKVSGPGAAPQFLDEFSTLGENTIAEFYQDRGFHCSVLSVEQFPLQPVKLEDLSGADKAANAAIILAILERQDRGPRRDAVLLNSAAAFLVAGRAKTLQDGWDTAAEVIDSGRAAAKLKSLVAASRKF